ncbi:hypothetical protein C8F01DRAFT_1234841 [Mycena amicta]|nr:hypothetical protein C8F01DRAFT_1234841 [Mycena amicta]
MSSAKEITNEIIEYIDDDDLKTEDLRWKEDEWIGCQRIWRDIPRSTAIQAERTRRIPPEVEQTLPASLLSPAGFFTTSKLPLFDPDDDDDDDATNIGFDVAPPTFIPTSPLELPLLPLKTIQRLDAQFAQAWFDGKKSIRVRDSAGVIRFMPLWGGTYAARVRAVARIFVVWKLAIYWIYEERNIEEPEESEWRARTINMLSSIPGWEGALPGPDDNFRFENLPELLGENMLHECVVDGLVRDVRRRLIQRDGTTGETLLVGLDFSQFLVERAANELGHRGEGELKKYADLLRSPAGPRYLAFPLHSPPFHWAACIIDLREGRIRFGDSLQHARPLVLFSELQKWLKNDVGLKTLKTSNNLPCGSQHDGVNCGVIAANTIAHNVLGDEMWHQIHARTYRLRAFCTLAESILHIEDDDEHLPFINLDAADSQPATPNTDTEIPDARPALPSAPPLLPTLPLPPPLSEDDLAAVVKSSTSSKKRARLQPIDDDDASEDGPPPEKRSKGKDGAVKKKPAKKPLPKVARPALPEHVQLEILESLKTGGQSETAKHDRIAAILICYGLFRGSEKKLEKLRRECKIAGGDPNPGVDILNPKQVVCSRCGQTVQLKALYDAQRFRDHWFNKKKPCKPLPAPNTLIMNFFKKPTGAPKPAATAIVRTPDVFEKPCPGLTGHIHPRIDYYIDNCQATVVSTRCLVKFTVKSAAAVDDPKVVCRMCWAVFLRREFRTALNRNRDKPHAKVKFTPKVYSNPIQSRLVGKFHGLREFLNERSDPKAGVFLRFARGVAQGQYKDNQVFLGLVETMQLARERQLRGVGMQNFKYPPELREFGALIRLSSPRTYCTMAQHFKLETERSIKHQAAQRPRFPVGITNQSFEFLAQYCREYGYRSDHPLCVSVDDTKLFAAMQPLQASSEKAWYLMGLPGEKQLKVTSPEELEKLLDGKYSPATKLRLWVISIPFPGIPPLVIAVLPIATGYDAAVLIKYQLQLLDGLVERSYRFISNIADGAAVERDVQARVAAKAKCVAHSIEPPHGSDESPLSIPLYDYKGNIFINTQDPSHARKTGRNNAMSGARGMVLGDFVVHYHQLYDLAVNTTDSPLYEKDVAGYDKQDDNAANRVFSSATLSKLLDNLEENMGLVAYLFVIGEMVDAYASRTMPHKKRAGAVIRAHLFFTTWKQLLQKTGYPLSRYYISHPADKIFKMLIDGLLGLIIIHRDHLPSNDIPLLPWKHGSMANEHAFAAIRAVFPDFSLVQVLTLLPNLRATMTRAKQALFSKGSFKRTRDGYTLCDLEEDAQVNYAELAKFPSDAELTDIFGEAIEENHTLWTLLHVDVRTLAELSTPSNIPAELARADDDNDAPAAVLELGIGDELTAALSAVQQVTGLSKAEEAEVDACAYAAAGLVVDSLAKIDDLPEIVDPDNLAQCRRDIARIIQMTPDAISAFLESLKASFGTGPSALPDSFNPHPGATASFADITSSELHSLVEIRHHHQTEHALKGVRTYKPGQNSESNPIPTDTSPVKRKTKEPTESQLLAQRIQAITRNADKSKTSAGLGRKARTEEHNDPKPAGNSANAAMAAQGRASDVIKLRQTAAKGLPCQPLVSDAQVNHLAPLRAGTWVFAIDRGEIFLGNMLTMYSKGGGKAGRHDWISQVTNIGQLSYGLGRLYQHSSGRNFNRVHRGARALGVSTFSHLPSGAILVRIAETVKVDDRAAEISNKTFTIFKELQMQKAGLLRMVSTLTAVKRKGNAGVNGLDLEEDDGVDD